MSKENSLLNFSWDSEDFKDLEGLPNQKNPFEDVSEEEEIIEEKEEEETTEEGEEEQEEKEVKDNTPNPFSDDVQEEVNTTISKTKDSSYWKDVYEDFKNSNLLRNVELEEGEEIDADKLFELQEEDYEQEVNKRLVSWAQDELDEDAKAFISFKKNGGKTSEFFSYLENRGDVVEDGDMEDENFQEKVVREQLKNEDWTQEEIDERVIYLKDSDKLEDFSKRYKKRLDEKLSKDEKKLQAQLEQRKAQDLENQKQYIDSIKDTLGKTTEVNGFKIPEKSKRKILDYITKPTYKMQGGNKITEMQKAISESFKDPEKLILLANLYMNDFDLSSFERDIKTKQTTKFKKQLEKRQDSKPIFGSSGGRSLAELF